ncbi:MAG: adenylyltransferase, partial [Flavobacterium sp.]
MTNYNPRYARHYSLEGFGEAAQEKLSAAKVLVIG